MKIKKVAIFLNRRKEALPIAREVAEFLRKKAVKITLQEEGKKNAQPANQEEHFSKTDLVLSIGGDGTFLRAARWVRDRGIPLLGIKVGGLGFLTEIGIPEWQKALELVLEGNFSLENRNTIKCQVQRKDQLVFSDFALNEVVIHRLSPHLLHLEVRLNENFAGSFSTDGLIISTPTGSTAYSLSAGGPIVSPKVSCFILTAICPHILSARTLVVSDNEKILLKETLASKASLVIDGQVEFKLAQEDLIQIARSPFEIKFLKVEKDFYQLVREKLKWVE